MYCQNCGAAVPDNAVKCPTCGVSIVASGNPVTIINNTVCHSVSSQKKKWVAFFLCLFLGIFGIHRFYVGKTGTALLYLFTGGIVGIGWIVDLISILCGGFRDKLGQFLR